MISKRPWNLRERSRLSRQAVDFIEKFGRAADVALKLLSINSKTAETPAFPLTRA
jgi:hypothetical protein